MFVIGELASVVNNTSKSNVTGVLKTQHTVEDLDLCLMELSVAAKHI